MLTFMLLLYDLFTVPFVACFGMGQTEFFTVMEWVVRAVWFLDLFVCFATGVYVNEILEQRFKFVALHYLKTWFFFDATLVGVVIMEVLLSVDRVSFG